jgi:AAA+ ATPase superfamily predicted ATPase
VDDIIRRDGFTDISAFWTLLYGRRKVGKTFILKHFVKLDHYAYVGRDGTVWVEKADVERFTVLEDFIRFTCGALQAGKTVAIDEFQRLPEHVLERIAGVHPNGKLVLSGSNMSVARKRNEVGPSPHRLHEQSRG